MRLLQSAGFGASDLLDGWPQDANVVNQAGKALEIGMEERNRENGVILRVPFQLVTFGVEPVSGVFNGFIGCPDAPDQPISFCDGPPVLFPLKLHPSRCSIWSGPCFVTLYEPSLLRNSISRCLGWLFSLLTWCWSGVSMAMANTIPNGFLSAASKQQLIDPFWAQR